MASVDDRIVRMEFDNAAFEKKVKTTLDSLAQLNKALQMTGATKGLADVSAAAEKVPGHFSGMGTAIEDVSKRFLALTTIAVTALSTITSKALQAGASFVKSFTFQPIFDGFQEFETNANSIQTILANTASKGTNLEQVNAALDQLNKYSDQTIYNFAQMAKNIGTFTAAGVDLNTSVNSIKGIANLAAMSGSSAEQASSAMYQLSQAIATGTLRLIDWNSVNAAGIGGEVFQNTLFETGKALKTLKDVPMTQTFQQWKDAGNSFRDTLQDGWITTEVLTTALSSFTGDMTEEMLITKGFTQDQATFLMKQAEIAKAAAQEVKTFSQLVGTVKEAIGTGWADTFRIVIGNFTEAKTLFTGINNAVSGFVQNQANARNQILQGWKDFGGRTALIEGFKDAFGALSFVITAVKDAFRDIFPPVTAATLIKLTASFREFALSLTPSAETLQKIHSIAQGFFAALSIGWTILKEGVQFIANITKQIAGIFGPGVTGGIAKFADGITALQQALVKGGGIHDFFVKLAEVIQKPIDLIKKFKEAVSNIFAGFSSRAGDALNDSMGRIGDRFEGLKNLFARAGDIWQPLENALKKVASVLAATWDVISNFFSDLWDKIAGAMGTGDFNAILDVINTSLLGGIVLLFRNFLKNGLSVDLSGGVFEKVNGMLDQLTSNLKAMQLKVKAEVIMKIAEAIAILTASMFVLSMIDSAKLTAALTAMAVGMGELIGSFAALQKLTVDPKSAAQFGIVSAGMIALASAVLILSLAVKAFSTMSWDELLRGLVAVTALLALMVGVSWGIGDKAGAMIAAGIGITGIAIGLTILGLALKIFATMSWGKMLQGLAGITLALLGIALAMQLMPGPMMVLTAAGLLLVAVAIGMLAGSILMLGKMNTGTMVKGLLGIAAAMLIIGLALNLIPPTAPLIAAGIWMVALALIPMAQALKMMGKMSWGEIARSLVALGGALLILGIGLTAMIVALPGAVALNVVVFALMGLAAVLKILGKMDFGTILSSLAKLAIILGGVALVAALLQPLVPAMLAMGIALIALGAGFALAGLGAILLGKGLEIIVGLGGKAASALKDLLQGIGEAIPALSTGLAKGLLNFIQTILDAAPVLAAGLVKLLNIILDALIQLLPKAQVLMGMLIDAMIQVIYTKAQPMIDAGFFLINQFLISLRNNISQIVTLVVDIVVAFLQAFQDQSGRVVTELAHTIEQWMLDVAKAEGEVAATILLGVGQAFIEGFLEGAQAQLNGPVYQWVLSIPGTILGWFAGAASWLLGAGNAIISGLWTGMMTMWNTVYGWLSGIGTMVTNAVSGAAGALVGVGRDIIDGLYNGLTGAWHKVKSWVEDKADFIKNAFKSAMSIFSPSRVMMNIGEMTILGYQVGLENSWKDVEDWLGTLNPAETFERQMERIGLAISNASDEISNMGGFNPVITPVLDLTQVANGASQISDMLDINKISTKEGYYAALGISNAQRAQQANTAIDPATTGNVIFEQTINAPTELSTADIYKATRNQITIAKEELSIP